MAERLGPCGCTLGHLDSVGALKAVLEATGDVGSWHLADSDTIHAWDGTQWLDGRYQDHADEVHPDDRQKVDTLRMLLRASEHR
jgi:hypothetical protein